MIYAHVVQAKSLKSVMEDKFLVNKSIIEGRGCFAASSIKRGELICFMRGKPLSIAQVIEKYKSGKLRIEDPLQIKEEQYLDLEEPYIFFNHSCCSNATIIGEVKLIAIKDIEKGEEITYDYSSTEWTSDKFGKYKEWTMKCNCGSVFCRKLIKEFPSLSPELQNKYIKNKMVQSFIVNKFMENKKN